MAKLLARLTSQLKGKNIKNASAVAKALAKKAGNVSSSGKLTAQGKKRQARGAAGRAKDRAAKYSGNKASDYKYNPKTNRATKK